jgi:hypothetical protein
MIGLGGGAEDGRIIPDERTMRPPGSFSKVGSEEIDTIS